MFGNPFNPLVNLSKGSGAVPGPAAHAAPPAAVK